jgi:hypothetical protein
MNDYLEASAPEVVIVDEDELHPMDGVNPDSYAWEILDGIFDDDDAPEPWGEALVGVRSKEGQVDRWLVYHRDLYAGTRPSVEAARALWDREERDLQAIMASWRASEDRGET